MTPTGAETISEDVQKRSIGKATRKHFTQKNSQPCAFVDDVLQDVSSLTELEPFQDYIHYSQTHQLRL